MALESEDVIVVVKKTTLICGKLDVCEGINASAD